MNKHPADRHWLRKTWSLADVAPQHRIRTSGEIEHARFPKRKIENERLPEEMQGFWLEENGRSQLPGLLGTRKKTLFCIVRVAD